MVGKSEPGRGRLQQGKGLSGRCEGLGRCAGARKLELRQGAVFAIPASDGKGQLWEDWLPALRKTLYHRTLKQCPAAARVGCCQKAKQMPSVTPGQGLPSTPRCSPRAPVHSRQREEQGVELSDHPRQNRTGHSDTQAGQRQKEMGTGTAPGTRHIRGAHPEQAPLTQG